MLENFLGQTDPVNVHAHTHDPEQMEPSYGESVTRFQEIHSPFCHVPIVHFVCRFTLGVGGKRASRRCEKKRGGAACQFAVRPVASSVIIQR